jgi:hypothetical protein
MDKRNLVLMASAGVLLLLILSSFTGSANMTMDLSQLSATYGAGNVQRLANLYAVLASAINPDTGQPLTTTQIQFMLAQALQETGLFTESPNYNNVDNFNNYAGITGNSRYAAGQGSLYAAYPSISAFVGDWLGLLTQNNDPLAAASITDFNHRLKMNRYYKDDETIYGNDLQVYYNILQQTEA